MREIKSLVCSIDEELEDAEEYAERYLELKVYNDPYADSYKKMAQQELEHSLILHQQTVEKIEKLRKIYTPPVDMLDKWNESHREYVEKTEHIKGLLEL